MSCEGCEEGAYVIDALAKLLAEIAIIVNGLPPSNISWSYHDLPEKVRALKQAQQPAALAVPAPSVEDAQRMGEQGGPAVESERLAFEAWMRGHCWALGAVWNGNGYAGPTEQGGYVCPQATRTRGLWAAWRDRAALSQQPAAAVPDVLCTTCGQPTMHMGPMCYGCCQDAMLAAANKENNNG